jgi:hypothetical protein
MAVVPNKPRHTACDPSPFLLKLYLRSTCTASRGLGVHTPLDLPPRHHKCFCLVPVQWLARANDPED